MISAELAAHPISTKRGLTALCRRASHRGISYYIRYETQTYSLTAINLLCASRAEGANLRFWERVCFCSHGARSATAS